MALIISEPQTRKLVDMAQAVALLDKMFRDRAAGKMRSVPRRRLKGSEKQLNMMAAWHQDSDLICLRSYAADANTITLDGLSSDDVFGDYFIHVGCGYAAIPDSFRINDDIGTVLTLVKAPSLVRANATLEP